VEELQRKIETIPLSQKRALLSWLRSEVSRDIRKEAAEKEDKRVFFKSPALLWTLLTPLLFFLTDSLIFRLGYTNYVEPFSSAGTVENYVSWLKRYPKGDKPEVIVVGDSRIAEGFSAIGAEAAVGKRIRFWNFGMSGASARVWYYALRDGDPTRRRFAAIMLPLDPYQDVDSATDEEDRLLDLNYLIGRLTPLDCFDFAASFRKPPYKAQMLSGCLLRGVTLRRDLHEFLLHFSDRIKLANDIHVNGLAYVNGYGGRPENLAGLSADFKTGTIHFPPGADPLQRVTIQAMVMRKPSAGNGEVTAYRKKWLGRILDLYKDSPTRIVFFEIQRAPIPIPEAPQSAAFLQWALKRPRVAALPQSTFRDLERPEYFFDGFHLNKAGRGLFTAKLAMQIPPIIDCAGKRR
jgi:hypothetical protein